MSEIDVDVLPGEDIYSLSDHHLGEGASIVEVVRPSRLTRWFRKEGDGPVVRRVDNPLEDFHQDETMAKFLKKIVRDRKPGRVVTVVLNGDIFDPLAVRWKGRIDVDPPVQRAAVVKMLTIIDAHRVYMTALTDFLRRPDTRLVIVAGNHDLALVWPDVQRVLVERLTDNDLSLVGKIRFIDHTVGFHWIHRGVLHEHGNHAEPHNAVDPKNAILHDKFGIPLKEPILNSPLGNILAVRLMNPLKYRNRLVGRIREQRRIWWHMARFDWEWVVYAARILVYVTVANMLSTFWDIRRKAGLLMSARVVLSTARPDPGESYARRRLKELGVRATVQGHTHTPVRITDEQGTIVNTGTASLQLKFKDPEIEHRWKWFRGIEEMLQRLQSLDAKQKIVRRMRAIAFTLATLVFVTTSFAVNRWHIWSYDVSDFKLPAAILFFSWLVAFAYRTLTVQPDIVDDTEFPFGLVRHEPDDPEEKNLRVDLKVYDPVDDAFREKV